MKIVKLALKIQLGKEVLIIPITSPWSENEDVQVRPLPEYHVYTQE